MQNRHKSMITMSSNKKKKLLPNNFSYKQRTNDMFG